MEERSASEKQMILELEGLDRLLKTLGSEGYSVIGPVLRDGAIIYDEISGIGDMPQGWTDDQEAGTYRIRRREDNALFGYAVGPHSWKQFLHPPDVKLVTITRNGKGFDSAPNNETAPKYAFVGARSCELHAIAVQDEVLMRQSHSDPIYRSRRENIFIIAVNCAEAGGTCFCVSMNTGPKADSGFDISLTEVIDASGHRFVAEAGTRRGSELIANLAARTATEEDSAAADAVVARTAGMMGRELDTDGIKELLYENYEHERWDEVASRCLTCANCTMVCPTCYCTAADDTTDLTGDNAERWRRWESCFTLDFSYIHGGSVRGSVKSRYRQWMTHKLATWIDQFGSSGCVGCGRCITWCPVGIDITEEAAAIRKSAGRKEVKGEDGK